jgi:hypothetical protein
LSKTIWFVKAFEFPFMANQSPMGFIGRTGNLIHYKMGDGFYVRSAPRKFKQTKATKLRAGEFGRASRIGSAIRVQLLPVIPNPTDRKMQARLVGVIFQWLSGQHPRADKSIPGFIDRFQFTETSHSVLDRWKIAMQVKNPAPGLLQIYIPAFVPAETIVAPTGLVFIWCKIATGVCDITTGKTMGRFSTELVFEYNSKIIAAQIISMNLPTPKGSLIVIGASLTYQIFKNGDTTHNTHKAYMPAGIVHALYTGS